jgi:hypothetical protein
MPIRPPRAFAKPETDPVSAALEHEVLAEKAATYARLMKRLEETLQALAALDGIAQFTPDANQSRPHAAQAHEARERERLLDAAGEALWHVVVQRDLCGFRHTDAFMRQLRVPKAVRLRMGLARARGAEPSSPLGLAKPRK